MRRLLPIAALVLMGLVVRAPMGWACSCVADATPQKQFTAADIVFIGSVSKVATPEETMGDVVVEMSVTQVFKGDVPANANVNTSVDVAGCGIAFVVGSKYTVFATDDNGVWRANLCGGTTNDTGVLARAGFHAGSPLTPFPTVAKTLSRPFDRTGPVTGAATLILLVGSAILVRRLTRPGGTSPPAG
jgi:hypothetical protein